MIDDEIIQQLIDLIENAESNLIHELVQLFEQENLSAFRTMRAHFASEEFDKIFSIAHSLKSACGNLGALRLQQFYERIEKSEAVSKGQQILLLIESAEREYGVAILELKAKLK
jgi:HPt (histidine-containing phosphotransfer) domain-containing protein